MATRFTVARLDIPLTFHSSDCKICPAQPATLNRLTNGYGRRRNLILLNFLVKSNLNSSRSPAEKYNISNGHSPFDREILILLIISRFPSFAFMQPSQVSRLNKLMGRRRRRQKKKKKRPEENWYAWFRFAREKVTSTI